MSTNASAAQAYFEENFRLAEADPVQAPEKLHLYKGLMLLARAIEDLDGRLQELESDLYQLKHYQEYQVIK